MKSKQHAEAIIYAVANVQSVDERYEIARRYGEFVAKRDRTFISNMYYRFLGITPKAK